MKKWLYAILGTVLLSHSSCTFKNEMGYPREFAEIKSFRVEHEAQKSIINPREMTVRTVLDEEADITAVKVLELEWTDGARISEMPDALDLSEPMTVRLENYHTYDWTISAEQPVERYVECDGLIDIRWTLKNHSAHVFVNKETNLHSVRINDMKLDLKGSEVTRYIEYVNNGDKVEEHVKEITFPVTLDCFLQKNFVVNYKGKETVWTIFFDHKKLEASVKTIDPWCYHAVVEAEFDGVSEWEMQYRKVGKEDWKSTREGSVQKNRLTVQIPDLEEDTDYELCFSVTGEKEVHAEFRTDKSSQLPNMGFNNWSKKDKVWNPYTDQRIWDTANTGVSIAGQSTTIPDYEHKVEGEASARMTTSTVFGLLAAGNLFTGRFDHLEMTTAYLYWGVPFSARPSRLVGYYDYKPETTVAPETLKGAGGIKNPYAEFNGKTDSMQIMAALIADDENGHNDKGAFYVISTKPGSPDLKNDPRVIAFGEIVSDRNTNGKFEKFSLDLVYRDNRKPAYVIVVACSSVYGNFFTGGVGSVLYVDDFRFEYE